MYIVVAPLAAPTVREPEDFKHLSIIASSRLDVAGVLAGLRDIGLASDRAENDHLTIDADALRAIASDAFAADPTSEWHRGFDAMLAYAESKGWYRAETGAVEVHIDWNA